MDKTPFIGLTRLDPGEALSLDGYSFQDLNPEIIDLLLRVGAITHRHDAHPNVADPTDDPVVGLLTAGGSIPSDTHIYVGYTYIDNDQGETALNDSPVVVTTQAGLTAPESGPDLAVDATVGTLLAGTYSYAITVTDGAGGESTLGISSETDIEPGSDTNQVTVSGLLALVAASGGTGWRLWRSIDGGTFNLVTSGITDSVVDDGTLCPNCDQEPPTQNTGQTNSTSQLQVTVPANPFILGFVTSFRIYASLDGSFSNPALLGEYPIADLGSVKTYPALNPSDGAPPAVSRSLMGAHMLDPTAEIDWSLAAYPSLGTGLSPHAINASGGADPAFEAGWSAATPVTVRLDPTGVVRLEGEVTKATAPADGDVIVFISHDVFSPSVEPSQTRRLTCASGDSTPSRVVGAVDFVPAVVAGVPGTNVIWRGGATGADNWLSLDGLTYTI